LGSNKKDPATPAAGTCFLARRRFSFCPPYPVTSCFNSPEPVMQVSEGSSLPGGGFRHHNTLLSLGWHNRTSAFHAPANLFTFSPPAALKPILRLAFPNVLMYGSLLRALSLCPRLLSFGRPSTVQIFYFFFNSPRDDRNPHAETPGLSSPPHSAQLAARLRSSFPPPKWHTVPPLAAPADSFQGPELLLLRFRSFVPPVTIYVRTLFPSNPPFGRIKGVSFSGSKTTFLSTPGPSLSF